MWNDKCQMFKMDSELDIIMQIYVGYWNIQENQLVFQFIMAKRLTVWISEKLCLGLKKISHCFNAQPVVWTRGYYKGRI